MTKKSFGSRLLLARVDKGLSQSELAEQAGVAAAQISRYEADKNSPRPHIAAKLAAALGVDVSWLVDGPAAGQELELERAKAAASPAEDRVEFVFQPSAQNIEKLKALSVLTGKSPRDLVQQMFDEMETYLLATPGSTVGSFMADMNNRLTELEAKFKAEKSKS
ncbi:helix-turn-helix domain-containing protein [Delftia tsuruhatensis]|uniref:helix-turn-helix domain-containing protein n=1 Tax=Delftia tsuruhatensis TaxID=180282 RepID=UPI00244C029C|nr:helix-turn-helix transcriptional regulator [Delftia tsuruhatensis]MDH0423655.1 helix-turn-helix domain-containing protein [Delftia tsuruhatensis]